MDSGMIVIHSLSYYCSPHQVVSELDVLSSWRMISHAYYLLNIVSDA